MSLGHLCFDGALSNISNPKIAIFYFALLPQFVNIGTAHPTACVFLLGLAFAGLTCLIKGPVGLVAGYLSGWLGQPQMPGLAPPLQRGGAHRFRGQAGFRASGVNPPYEW
jgi:threonine/homoserine/homoserine lactone efflux protein